jgi:hypothetical protein
MTSISDDILRFSRQCSCIGDEDIKLLSKVAVVCTLALKCFFKRFIVRRAREPLLFQYSSDSTPVTTRQRFASSVALWSVVRKTKRVGHFLAERAFVVDLAGNSAVLFGPPRDLADTTAWAHLSAFQKLTPYPRSMGHVGLLHCHHIWDRAVMTACTRHHHRLFLAHEDVAVRTLSPSEGFRMWCMTFFTSVGCFLHDLHNGFKKGLCSYVNDPVTMRSMWICIESAKNSFALVSLHMCDWITERLIFEPWNVAGLRDMWQMLGFKDHWLELLVDMEVRFADGQLRVSPRYKDDPELPQLLTMVLAKAWSFRKWTDSRWVSMGRSCRTVLSCALLGLRDLVRFLVDVKKVSRYHIGGLMDHMTDSVLEMVVVTSASSFGIDAVLHLVMGDDRVPKHLAAIDGLLLDNFRFTAGISWDVWQTFSGATGSFRNLKAIRAPRSSIPMARKRWNL